MVTNNNILRIDRGFDINFALLTKNPELGTVLQQLHYWLQKETVGKVIDGVKYVYNTYKDWVDNFPFWSEWQVRSRLNKLRSLGVVKVIRHWATQWKQTNFYTIDYDNLAKFLSRGSAESTENSEMCLNTDRDGRNSQNEMVETHISSYIQKNTPTENNQRKYPSPTPPITSPKKSKTSIKINSGGGSSSTSSSKKKPINQEKCPQPKVELSKVIARPKKPDVGNKAVGIETSNGDVDEKVNKQSECTIKQAVQEVVQSLDVRVEVVPEPVQQVEVMPEPVQPPIVEESQSVAVESPPESEPKTERQKTRKGTKPKKRVHENALWKTIEERNNFERALTHRLVNGVGKARNPMALVRYVMNQITQGISHPYWEEWISGIVIGTCETQEWEASPGYPYPKFVEYLVEKLKYDEESRSQAQFRVGKILNDITQARIHWREFKRILEGLRQDADKAAVNGQQVALPTWFIDRAEISLERAGESAQTLTKLAPEQTDWIYQGLPESEKLLTAAANSLQPGIPELPPGEPEPKPSEITVIADLWAGDNGNNEEDEDFCFNGFIDMGYLEQQAKKVAANPGKLSLLLMDFKSAVAQATQKQRDKIRQMIEPIYPELLDFL